MHMYCLLKLSSYQIFVDKEEHFNNSVSRLSDIPLSKYKVLEHSRPVLEHSSVIATIGFTKNFNSWRNHISLTSIMESSIDQCVTSIK